MQLPPKPGPHLPEHAAELRKESYTMALYVAICLLAALLALPMTMATRWSSMNRNCTQNGQSRLLPKCCHESSRPFPHFTERVSDKGFCSSGGRI